MYLFELLSRIRSWTQFFDAFYHRKSKSRKSSDQIYSNEPLIDQSHDISTIQSTNRLNKHVSFQEESDTFHHTWSQGMCFKTQIR